MIIPYHINHVKEILDKIPHYFRGFHGYAFITHKLLNNGLEHPDIPCSNLIVTKEGVKYMNYESCKLPFYLVYLTREETNGLKEIVQSHRGRFAISHAMTYDPNISMIEIRQKILRRLEILYHLALNDDSYHSSNVIGPNIFWLGQIIHCVQDSYSRVHTLRVITRQKKLSKQRPFIYQRNTMISKKEYEYDTFRLIKTISELLEKKHFKRSNDLHQYLLKNIRKPTLRHFITRYPNDVAQIFKQILFFKIQKKRTHMLYKGEKKLPSTRNINMHTSDYAKFPYIISFRYIPHERGCGRLFHFNYDQPYTTQKAGLEKYMGANVRFILKLYKTHVLDKSKSLQKKIDEMISYISKNVFPLLHGYETNVSAIAGFPDKCDLSSKNVYKYHENALRMQKLDLMDKNIMIMKKLGKISDSDFATVKTLHRKCHKTHAKMKSDLMMQRYMKKYIITVKRLLGISFMKFTSQLYNNP
jgi:hypothetical protein